MKKRMSSGVHASISEGKIELLDLKQIITLPLSENGFIS
jgi:hypothetical protein